jgi:hypothetical protein
MRTKVHALPRWCDLVTAAGSRLAAALAVALLLAPTSGLAQSLTFAGAEIGKAPKDFEPALTGNGLPGRWEIVADATADGGKALAQVSTDPTSYRFPLLIYMPTAPADVEATIRFKSISGKVDQAAGVAVRLLDRNNYYIVRANALENNVRLYRMVAGKREQFAGTGVKVTAGEWHTLTLRARGNQFTVSYDGKELFTAKDDRFVSPGKVALWTKADSVTRFDRLTITPLQ